VDIGRQVGEDLPLAAQLRLARTVRCVKLRQPIARVAQEHNELPVVSALLLQHFDARGLTLVFEPAFQALLLHRDRESFIEPRVVLDVEQLVGELVEDHCRELIAAVAHHRAHHRVRELAEGGVCGDALDHDVISLLLESRGEGAGAILTEVASIGHAACDGKAPLLRLHRELRCGNDVPYDVGTVDLDVRTIALVVGQLEHT